MQSITPHSSDESVTLVEILELIRPFAEFEPIIQAAMARLEREGVDSLIRMQFYAHADSSEVGAVITFSNPGQLMDHIRMISDWEEFKAFFRTVKPLDVRLYGKVTPEAEAWIKTFDLSIKKFDHYVAGFVR